MQELIAIPQLLVFGLVLVFLIIAIRVVKFTKRGKQITVTGHFWSSNPKEKTDEQP